MNIFAVYEGDNLIFSNGHVDPLIINIVLGLNDIGTNFLQDNFVFMVLDSFSINARVTNSLVFIVLNMNKEKVDLDPFIEAYTGQNNVIEQ
jgi:hypothetical protein